MALRSSEKIEDLLWLLRNKYASIGCQGHYSVPELVLLIPLAKNP
jgi:hypothetical protein